MNTSQKAVLLVAVALADDINNFSEIVKSSPLSQILPILDTLPENCTTDEYYEPIDNYLVLSSMEQVTTLLNEDGLQFYEHYSAYTVINDIEQ